MYENGEGVPRDYVIAYAWYNIAIANGAGQAEASRDKIQSVLTPTQREQAQNYQLKSTIVFNLPKHSSDVSAPKWVVREPDFRRILS